MAEHLDVYKRQLVHQGGLAVVDVGDDGYISQLGILQSGAPQILFSNNIVVNSTLYYTVTGPKTQCVFQTFLLPDHFTPLTGLPTLGYNKQAPLHPLRLPFRRAGRLHRPKARSFVAPVLFAAPGKRTFFGAGRDLQNVPPPGSPVWQTSLFHPYTRQ